jgi:hypothetical protein
MSRISAWRSGTRGSLAEQFGRTRSGRAAVGSTARPADRPVRLPNAAGRRQCGQIYTCLTRRMKVIQPSTGTLQPREASSQSGSSFERRCLSGSGIGVSTRPNARRRNIGSYLQAQVTDRESSALHGRHTPRIRGTARRGYSYGPVKSIELRYATLTCHQDNNRPCSKRVGVIGRVRFSFRVGRSRLARVNEHFPASRIRACRWKNEEYLFPVTIDERKEAARRLRVVARAGDPHAERTGLRVRPLTGVDFLSVSLEPPQVGHARSVFCLNPSRKLAGFAWYAGSGSTLVPFLYWVGFRALGRACAAGGCLGLHLPFPGPATTPAVCAGLRIRAPFN